MSLFATTDLPAGVSFLRGVARDPAIRAAVEQVMITAPLRHMQTPRGAISVSMTNCGDWGWTSDASRYRYSAVDPLTQTPWPAMPHTLTQHARAGCDSSHQAHCVITLWRTRGSP